MYFSLTVQDGFSPVYVASQMGHTDVVDVLVKAGADVNQTLTKVCQWWWKNLLLPLYNYYYLYLLSLLKVVCYSVDGSTV